MNGHFHIYFTIYRGCFSKIQLQINVVPEIHKLVILVHASELGNIISVGAACVCENYNLVN